MALPTLQIIIASTRPGRIGLPIGQWVTERANEHGGFEVELIDLAEVALPFLDEPNHPRLAKYTHDHTREWSDTIERGDAFVFVTPEYNHGFPAPLKNALDFLYNEWNNKPVAFVSYGGVAGGTRAVALLKPVLSALQMFPVIQGVQIPFVARQMNDGAFEPTDLLDGAAKTMFDSLSRMVQVTIPLRASQQD